MSDAIPSVLQRWNLSEDELTEVIDNNPSLRGMILGYAAEAKLRRMWFSREEFSDVIKYDDHDREKKGDLAVTYKGHRFVIECKSLQSNSIKCEGDGWIGKSQVDASDRRTISLPDGSNVTTTCLKVGEFDLLAVNLFAFTDEWRFVFAKNSALPRTAFRKYNEYQRQFLLSTLVNVSWPAKEPFWKEPFSLLDEMVQEREA